MNMSPVFVVILASLHAARTATTSVMKKTVTKSRVFVSMLLASLFLAGTGMISAALADWPLHTLRV